MTAVTEQEIESMPSAADKPMSNDEYRAVLDSLNWNQGEAAAALGVTLRTSGNYATGASTIPLATAKLLRLWAQLPSKHRPQFD